ncbi:uroporphyrinogen-III synthase [Chryseobacterium sp. SNU WT5]|uniref:uroporphyrinogen-III synthase n=1 Tax=Chryseobacterium sp. SNU WT5 TaxID=2594269 RepID=UPI00117C18FB|nr:uroporphyrinogen-III synthase [Chryseobacterium sp. SNU WT5]QDP85263.1 uroporphyrinogen-III synthase [Chryseobacterium sp. SNU WT5]
MKILFTKILDEKEVSVVLEAEFHSSFLEVIKIAFIKIPSFPLENKSLIFTSVNGVEAFFKNGFKPHENFTGRNFNKIYCVGKKTKMRLRKYGFGVFKMKKNAKELSEFIIEHCSKEKFIHFCGNLALDILQKKLPLQNIGYKKVVVYETELTYPKVEEEYDAVAFFSPSGVRSFVENNNLDFKQIYAIGETTGEEVRKHTSQNIFIGKDNDLKALLKLIKKEGSLQIPM